MSLSWHERRVFVTGDTGFVGGWLTQALLSVGARVDGYSLTDPAAMSVAGALGARQSYVPRRADIRDLPSLRRALEASDPEVIFHLAAIVSGEAAADFEKGYRINLDGTRMLFDAIRRIGDGYHPRVVFTSSIAVFGAPFPEAIGDEFFNTPCIRIGVSGDCAPRVWIRNANCFCSYSRAMMPNVAVGMNFTSLDG
jgi:nucleoside-diphosphate-sugar epimerase